MAGETSSKWRYPNTVPEEAREMVFTLLEKEEKIAEHEAQIAEHEAQIRLLSANINDLKEECAEIEAEISAYSPKSAPTNLSSVTSLIHRLPDEALHMVFTYYLLDSHRSIRTLILVCRRWNWTVMTSPSLWAQIDIRTSGNILQDYEKEIEGYITTCMERSNGLLLDINLDFTSFPSLLDFAQQQLQDALVNIVDYENRYIVLNALDDRMLDCPEYEERSNGFFDILLGPNRENAQQWKSLKLTYPSFEESSNSYLWGESSAPAPNLVSVELVNITSYNSLSVNFINLDSLENLRFYGTVSIGRLDLPYPSLQNLDLSYPSLEYINDAQLNSFISLKTLTLRFDATLKTNDRVYRYSMFGGFRSPRQQPRVKIELPSLKVLKLVEMHEDFSTITFSCPTLETVVVESVNSGGKLPPLSANTFHWSLPAQMRRTFNDTKTHNVLVPFLTSPLTARHWIIPDFARSTFIECALEPEGWRALDSVRETSVEYPNGRIEQFTM